MDLAGPSVAELLERDHRRLDELFGSFLGAGDRESAARAIGRFDAALRAHTRLEEENVYPAPPPGKLVTQPDETERDRIFRELRIEHVQIRELSGMIVRQLGEKGDPGAALALAGSLARRWEAHTAREEREALDLLRDSLGAAEEAAVREALGDLAAGE